MNVCTVCIQYHFYINVLSIEVNSAYIILAGQKHLSTIYWQNGVTNIGYQGIANNSD